MRQNRIKQSKVATLRVLSEQQSNESLGLQSVRELYENYEIVQIGKYYPYNNQYDDLMWGCAWRAIQTVLSARQIYTDFKELLAKYSRKQVLMDVVRNKIKQLPIQRLQQNKWAPEQNENNWAQPLIGKIICADYKIKSKLILVNGYPKAYAPQFVFQECINFTCFWRLIKQSIPYSPIMIDDGKISLCIIGYKQGINQQKHLILADPHIISNKSCKTAGIYQVVLDKDGKQIRNDVDPKQAKQYLFSTQNRIDFCQSKWMLISILRQ